MITFNDHSTEEPYLIFNKKYEEALKKSQQNIEAINISSYSEQSKEVNSRLVNLKFVNNNNFIFFSNYGSPKSQEFNEHEQISALFYWNKVNTQIRMKALIKRTSVEFNNKYFFNRSELKNALAISSYQSQPIDSFDKVLHRYNKALEAGNLTKCPEFWGGYSFTPYYFEFWEGHESRLNKREAYEKSDDSWNHLILQP